MSGNNTRKGDKQELKYQAIPKTYPPAPDVTGNSLHLLLLFGKRFPCLTFVHKVLVDLTEVALVQFFDYLLLCRGHLLIKK